jgi:phage gp46-like protein
VTDVLLRQTNDGGEITIAGGLVLLSEGLETAAYLSLFGGNEDDPGDGDSRLEWWGNLLESEPERAYRSETQYLLRALPAVPFNLRRIEQAALRDLKWMSDTGLASSAAASASIPGKDHVALAITIVTRAGQKLELSFG